MNNRQPLTQINYNEHKMLGKNKTLIPPKYKPKYEQISKNKKYMLPIIPDSLSEFKT